MDIIDWICGMAVVVGLTVIISAVAHDISENNTEESKCYPYLKIKGFHHGKHHFAICAREDGPEVRLIK